MLFFHTAIDFDFLFNLTSNVFKKHPLGAVDEAVVACLELADFAFVQRAVSHIFTFVASFLNIAVRFLEDQLVLGKVVYNLAVELFGTMIVEALFFVDEGLTFQILEKIDG